MWTGNGLDWKPPRQAIVRRLVRHASNGAIVCLRDGRLTQPKPGVHETLEAVRRLIPELRGRGFRFETVSQILCPTK
jgi:peptidoglycan/xylan/chitin deacetylase (PgdA/CDA1 family)